MNSARVIVTRPEQGAQHWVRQLQLAGIDAEALPLIENMGLKIEYMGGPYEIKPIDSDKGVYIHEFVGKYAKDALTDFNRIKPAFEESFVKAWNGDVENDAFNALTLRTGMAWR